VLNIRQGAADARSLIPESSPVGIAPPPGTA
jgi:hypothetical protein